MRIAALSDIHGNDLALAAVLDDIRRTGGADEIWVLGDIVAMGPHPVRVLEMLNAVPNLRCIKGNTDRYVFTGQDRPAPSMSDAASDPTKLRALVECAGTFAWTQGCLTATGWLDWIERLPTEILRELPDGTRALGVHASPGNDDGPGLRPDWSDEQLDALVAASTANLILAGHTHRPMNRLVNGRRLVNLGSVSNPLPFDLRASYVALSADAGGYEIEHRRVDYNHNAVIAELRRLRHPASRYIVHHLSGGLQES
ncbi:MAG: metallophosphoesterase family protein [Alphaproteobacteria bacterium]|nr:metallophosphoesterase family protein [Alphaproteobacteria bacterium]